MYRYPVLKGERSTTGVLLRVAVTQSVSGKNANQYIVLRR